MYYLLQGTLQELVALTCYLTENLTASIISGENLSTAAYWHSGTQRFDPLQACFLISQSDGLDVLA